MDIETCRHNYDDALRVAPFHYVCPDCRQDISLGVILLEEVLMEQEGLLQEAGR